MHTLVGFSQVCFISPATFESVLFNLALAQLRLPCCVFMFSPCSDLYFSERLEEAVLGAAPSPHCQPDVFKAVYHVSLFQATWLKIFSQSPFHF